MLAISMRCFSHACAISLRHFSFMCYFPLLGFSVLFLLFLCFLVWVSVFHRFFSFLFLAAFYLPFFLGALLLSRIAESSDGNLGSLLALTFSRISGETKVPGKLAKRHLGYAFLYWILCEMLRSWLNSLFAVALALAGIKW